jgi:hypothetical protein
MAIPKKTPAEIFSYLTEMLQGARFPSRVFRPIMQNINALFGRTTTDPTVDDGFDAGYREFKSIWKNTTTGDIFLCVDDTNGAAVWTKTYVNCKQVLMVISQAGTSAPTIRFDRNDLDVADLITAEYVAVGQYKLLSPAFVIDKVSCIASAGVGTTNDTTAKAYFDVAGIVMLDNISISNGFEDGFSETTVLINIKP